MAVIDLKKLMAGDALTNLVCPDNRKSIEFVDVGGIGLYLKVTKNSPGIGTFHLRYRGLSNNGKTSHFKLGRTTEITLIEARKKALHLKAEIAAGNDPREKALSKKAVPTFAEFFTQQYYPFILGYKRSASKDLSMYNVRLKKLLGDKRLDKISRLDIERLVTQLNATGELSPASINHHTKLVKYVVRKSVDWNVLETNNLSGIPMLKIDNQIENYLDDEQLRRLLFVLNNEKGKKIRMTCMVCLFLLSTGARLNEALSAKWENIDRKNRLWLIPATDSKSSKRRNVPLNDAALDVLDQLGTEDSEYLFVSHRSKTGGPLRSIARGWSSLRKKAGLDFLRIHDLRHNYASMLVNNGVSIYSVSQVLGHSSVIVTQRYAHLSTKTLQDASQNAAKCINAAMASNL